MPWPERQRPKNKVAEDLRSVVVEACAVWRRHTVARDGDVGSMYRRARAPAVPPVKCRVLRISPEGISGY